MKYKIILVINIAIIIFEIIGIIVRLQVKGALGIEYYTMDSNLLALAASSAYIFYTLRGKPQPKWLNILKYVSTTMLAVTFLVVIFVLSPMLENGLYILLLTDQMLYNHLICPILAIASFLLLEKHNLKNKDILWPIGTTLLYAVILIILNLCRVIDGPYPFLQVYNQSIFATLGWAILILGGTGLISFATLHLRKEK